MQTVMIKVDVVIKINNYKVPRISTVVICHTPSYTYIICSSVYVVKIHTLYSIICCGILYTNNPSTLPSSMHLSNTCPTPGVWGEYRGFD